MKLDPVFLVAPQPNPPTMPTRRAFLIAGTTFTLGTAVGGACGYSIAAKPDPVAAGDVDVDLEPTNDVELDELRRLAVKAPIAELIEKRLVFLNSLTKNYPKDEILWKGASRLADAVLANRPISDRRLFSRFLAQVIEQGDPLFTKALQPRVRDLRRVE